MKKAVYYVMLALAAILIVAGCQGCFPYEDAVWELRLVPLNGTELAKAYTDDSGRMYLPASEVANILARPSAGADIDFGDVLSTKTLLYVLMNVGNRDVYDVTFSAGDLTVYPEYIGVIPAQGEGGEIVALPIVSFIKEHVIPISGVGSLMDMTAGEFTDLLSLSYNYTLEDSVGAESFDVVDNYTVAGEKMAAILDVFVSGINVTEAAVNPIEEYMTSYFHEPLLSANIYSNDLDTISIQNSGNVPMRVAVLNPYLQVLAHEDPVVLDTVVLAGQTLELVGIVRDAIYFENSGIDHSRGNILLFGSDRNQPYLFSLSGNYCTDGDLGFHFSESQR
ncbi:MAG: hypothetical protein JXR21_00395 [Candidatus Marinimicrobia bacterium]|nr:hypothetical protein [Candidatus Neomarinimicrobiota bacterium]